MLLGIRVSLSCRCKWSRIRIVQLQKRKTCFIVGRSDGQLSVGSLSLDAFEHVLKRVVEEACAGSSGAVRERAGSVVSVDPSGVSGGRSKVPSNFAGSVQSDVQSNTSKTSETAEKTGKPGKNLIKSW